MAYGSVVDQQAGKPQDNDSSSLSASTTLFVVLVFVVCIIAFSVAAEKKRWIMPALFLAVFVAWPLYGVLTH